MAAAARGATVAVRKGSTGDFTGVTNGAASAAVALDVGANAVTVRVTAEDGTTKDYTATVTRAASDGTPPTAALVSNFAQIVNGRNAFERRTIAGPFTTGSHAAGYLLRGVEADIAVVGTLSSPRTVLPANEAAAYRAELWSDSGGDPDAKIADLTVPSTISDGVQRVRRAGGRHRARAVHDLPHGHLQNRQPAADPGLAHVAVRPRGRRRGARLGNRGPHALPEPEHAGRERQLGEVQR